MGRLPVRGRCHAGGLSTDPGGRRIALADAAAVLGAQEWTAIRERHGLGAMIATVERLQQQQLIVSVDARRLARLMLGVLYGAIEALPDDAAAMLMGDGRNAHAHACDACLACALRTACLAGRLAVADDGRKRLRCRHIVQRVFTM
ncbi:hypothetical protein LP420_35050 [Massilia sp. B-10]|nr:hypothetical protein LP420_35050 [Massilia sp. B-10]